MVAMPAGCDVGEPSPQQVGAPALTVAEVRATTDIDDDSQPVRTKLDPGGETENVLSTASFVVKFDRYLLPASAIRQSVCIQADFGKQVNAPEDCVAPVALEPAYDPVHREVIFRLEPGKELTKGIRYSLTMLRPPDDSSRIGFRAFDGTPLQENVRIDFKTRAENPEGTQPERPPSGDFFCKRDAECLSTCTPPCLDCVIGAARYVATCAYGAACHQNLLDGKQVVRGAAEGLNLDLGASLNTLDYIRATAIGHVAHQTQTGEHADEPDKSPLRFGRAMPIVDPGNPGNSYLLYKLIVGPNGVEPTSDPGEAAKRTQEIERLRESVVVGMPMPPPQSGLSFKLFSGGTATDPSFITHVDGMDIVTAWIAGGAEIRDCSAPPHD